jgi:hypothetical protein
MSRFISASVLAITVLASSAASAFSTVHPTPQQAQALKPEIKQQVAPELGVKASQVRVTVNLNPKMPKFFLGNGFSRWKASAKPDGQKGPKETVVGYIAYEGTDPSGAPKFSTPQTGGVTRTPSASRASAPQAQSATSATRIKYPAGVSKEGRDAIAKFVGSSQGKVRVVVEGSVVLLENKSTFTGGPNPGPKAWRAFAHGTLDGKGNVSGLSPIYRLAAPTAD